MTEKNLDVLLTSMNPSLHNDEFVFCTVSDDVFQKLKIAPLCTFREEEGISLILKRSAADQASLSYTGSWSLITCKINSDLTSVGFLATMSNALAKAGIALNPVSAYFHDHLFVPKERTQECLSILQDLSKSTRSSF
ncbi:MAG: ACT domain-containing protein [Candidatus Obscuribacterales bacterium]|nr:ACT domain-containing protein [Candidatus Obscuribacterales bacterium]